ncbi:MAG TPA: lactate 2-monooxygenase [Terriglobales bacterium]|nr:lactate 2-monooxygenase [Terriglobales bacterium]
MSEQKGPAGSANFGMERQMDIYLGALSGKRLSVPVPVTELEKKAKDALEPTAYDYVAGGAAGERTMRANLDAFSRWEIVPRMLRDVSQRDITVEIFGQRLPSPVLLGPVGVQGIVHAEGELPAAKAAASMGVPFVISTLSSRSMEEVANAMGDGVRWFQLYWGKDPELTASMLNRAEKSGYAALVVTLDTPMLGWRPRDLQHPYLPFLLGKGLANYFGDPVFCARLGCKAEENPAGAIRLWSQVFSNTTLTWKDLAWLREHTKLPVVLKGIQHADDAKRALDAGVDGVLVSNHGGRQVDGGIGTLDALPSVVEAINEKAVVLFDSGVRHGADVFKALALGARAVLLGRLYIWGLAVAAEQGVRDVVLNLVADFDLTLGLSGWKSCRELGAEAVRRRS